MNESNTQAVQPYIAPATAPALTSANLLNPETYRQMMQIAEFMAKGVATIPKHLQGKPADCLAIVLQSMVWGMLPHVVAQKTFLSPSGILGYEAQLVNAVAVSSGALEGQPNFEFIGDWSKIRGKVEWVAKPSDGGDAKEKGYFKAAWPASDEIGLGVRVIATLRGEKKPRTHEVFLTQCKPRFSTQWATDPEQQITYIGVRKFVRRHCPGALMGIHTIEELEEIQTEQVGENTTRGRQQPRASDILPEYPADRFAENLPKWSKRIEGGKQSPADIIATISGEYTLNKDQKDAILAIKPKPKDAPPPTADTVDGGAQ